MSSPQGERPDEPLIASIRRDRRPSLLAGFGDATGHWTVPGTLVLFAGLLLFTFAFVPRWNYLMAGLLILLAAPAAYLGVRRGNEYALPGGVVAVLATIAGVVIFALARG